MKLRNLLLSGLVLAGLAGCASPGKKGLDKIIDNRVIENRAFVSQINDKNIIPIEHNSIEEFRFDFDDAYETAGKIRYKEEPCFCDNMQTPEKTALLGTGDCEDSAVYLSKLLTDRGIHNEIIFGQIHSSDGLRFHVWNRVIENNDKYILDPVCRTRILEKEVPAGYYNEFLCIKPKGYSILDIAEYSLKSRIKEIPAVARIAINKDLNKRIIGGRK